MKITKSQLKQIIKEELESALAEEPDEEDRRLGSIGVKDTVDWEWIYEVLIDLQKEVSKYYRRCTPEGRKRYPEVSLECDAVKLVAGDLYAVFDRVQSIIQDERIVKKKQ